MHSNLSQLLAGIEAPGAFSATIQLPSNTLGLSVGDAAPLRFPITQAQARELCEQARPAKFGKRDETILDPTVRNTSEISKRHLRIDEGRWKRALTPALEQLRAELGLPEGVRLEAELHNLLVYGPGQFFLDHQDSEKSDDMVGTLVVTLPSSFSGGELIVKHHESHRSFGGSRKNLVLLAFYADCHHEVRPVTKGYRVVLTYNLLRRGERRTIPKTNGLEALTAEVQRHFEEARPSGWREEPQPPPDRLIYLLDHEYTQRGLDFDRLKNGDIARVGALREVAARLDCEVALALADVREVWSCEDGTYCDDLIDAEVELRHFVGSSASASLSNRVRDEELCFTKPSVQFEPFASEYEGFQGNWGNTMDRWYHRAALVLWPRSRAFVLEAKASARRAIEVISKAIDAGELDRARVLASSMAPFWNASAQAESSPTFPAKVFDVAARIEDPDLASMLLRPFTLAACDHRSARPLRQIVDRYGLDFAKTCISTWMKARSLQASPWISKLPDFLGPLALGGDESAKLARWVLAEQWETFTRRRDIEEDHLGPKERAHAILELNPVILGLIEGTLITGQPELRAAMLQHLSANYPLAGFVSLLKSAHAQYPAQALVQLELSRLHAQVTAALNARLEQPPRAEDDWSIVAPKPCCELCKTLVSFLESSKEKRLSWPLAKDRRRHIHNVLDAHELPVTHRTIRSGSPYTLVLEKTDALFTLEAKARKVCAAELAWLQANASSFE